MLQARCVKPRTSGQSVLIVTDLTHNAVDEPTRYEHYNCTLSILPVEMSQHVQYFGSIDWARTSLGPIDRWSPQLGSAVNTVLMDLHPSVLFWGEGIVMIYNEAYIQILDILHPCMGSSARVLSATIEVILNP
jgi:hypothetical protein